MKNRDLLLSPGLFVRLRFPVGAAHEALLVNEEALGADQGERFLYVVNDKDEVVYRRVKVGVLREGKRVVREGIAAKDSVIVTGLQRVKPGDKVIAKPYVAAVASKPDGTAPPKTEANPGKENASKEDVGKEKSDVKKTSETKVSNPPSK